MTFLFVLAAMVGMRPTANPGRYFRTHSQASSPRSITPTQLPSPRTLSIPALAPTDTSARRDLLPDRWAVAHPGSILQARQLESRHALEQRRTRRTARRLQTSA